MSLRNKVIRLAHDNLDLRPRLLPILKQAGSVDLLEYRKFEASGGALHLYLINRQGVQHVLWLETGGNLSYDIKASGPRSKAVFDMLTRSIVQGVERPPMEVSSTKADTKALKSLKFITTSPLIGLDWGKAVVPDESEDPEMLDFYRLFKRQLKEWKRDGGGMKKALPVMRHDYWPVFHSMIKAAVKKTYGSKITLFRGLHSDQAVSILRDNEPFRVHRLSSWTTNREYAKHFVLFGFGGDPFASLNLQPQLQRRRKPWMVARSDFSVSSVIFAPVTLPEFTPEPDILMKLFAHEWEFVIAHPQGIVKKFKIVDKTRGRMAGIVKRVSKWVVTGTHGEEVFVNPSQKEFTEVTKSPPVGVLNASIDKKGDLYVWAGRYMMHHNAVKFGIPNHITLYVYPGEGVVEISPSVMNPTDSMATEVEKNRHLNRLLGRDFRVENFRLT